MPAALTHYCFAMTLETELSDAFRLGTQGPDPFFFYGMIPWKKRQDKAEIQNVGEALHKSDFSLFYARMWAKANQEEDPKAKNFLCDYVRGLLAHYCLDRICHPYIFYRSGFDENGALTLHYSFAHKVFEALLDLKVVERYGASRNPSKAMKIRKDDAKAISKLWEGSSIRGLNEDTFFHAYSDYITIENFLQSRTGWKRPLWKLLGKEGDMYGFTYPGSGKKYEEHDVENLRKMTWKDPVSGRESRQNISDLFDEARALFEKGDALLKQNCDVSQIAASLLAFEEGIDHDGSPFSSKKIYRDENSPF